MEQDEGTLTIAEASKTTGCSVKALQRRIERGSLTATMSNGLRLVSIDDLRAAGLLTDGDLAVPDVELDEILRLLERQTELRELAEQRVVVERGRTDERLAEATLLHERVRELEQQAGRRWYKRR